MTETATMTMDASMPPTDMAEEAAYRIVSEQFGSHHARCIVAPPATPTRWAIAGVMALS